VVDVDGHKGQESIAELEQIHGPLPQTLTSQTGRGRHLWFGYPEKEIKTSAGKLGEGIDIRADGGYVVVPPSTHASGRRYRWENPDTPVVSMPDWMVSKLTEMISRPDAMSRNERRYIDGPEEGDPAGGPWIEEGSRNDELYRHACFLRWQGREYEDILDELQQFNRLACVVPLEYLELEQITTSACRYSPGSASTANAQNPLWWFPFDVKEWSSDTRIELLTDYQAGWLIWLRVAAWKNRGVLPDDHETLWKLARANNKKKFKLEAPRVLQFFQPGCDQTIEDPHFVKEWHERALNVEKKRKAGKIGAESRRRNTETIREAA
jgi:hypothetical protein